MRDGENRKVVLFHVLVSLFRLALLWVRVASKAHCRLTRQYLLKAFHTGLVRTSLVCATLRVLFVQVGVQRYDHPNPWESLRFELNDFGVEEFAAALRSIDGVSDRKRL